MPFWLEPTGIERNPRPTDRGAANHNATPSVGASQYAHDGRIHCETIQHEGHSRLRQGIREERESGRMGEEKIQRLPKLIHPEQFQAFEHGPPPDERCDGGDVRRCPDREQVQFAINGKRLGAGPDPRMV